MANRLLEKFPPRLLNIMGNIAAKMPRTILALRYYRWTKKRIDWKNPADLQEFVLANLLDARNKPEKLRLYTILADKIKARDYVAERIGTSALTRLYGIWQSPDDIDWDMLPPKFVLKTNNGCGTNLIVRDKSKLDIQMTKKTLSKWLSMPYGQLSGQIQYSAIPPMLLAEELLEIDGRPGELPQDYKFFCFDGEPRFILYYEDRKPNGHITPNMAYTTDWTPIDGVVRFPTTHPVDAPASLAQMTEAARKLSSGLRFARIDFYDINGKLYFGEVTLTPDVQTNFVPEFLMQTLQDYVLKH